MGACCTKKSDKQAGIQQQIEQTVFEQQKLREEEEEEEIQINQGMRDFSTKRSMNIVQTTLATHQEQERSDDGKIEIIQEEEKVQEKQVKKSKQKVVKDDINYFKKYEHVLHVKQIIVELEKNQNQYHYSLVVRVDYKDYINEAKMTGVLITQSDFSNYQLLPKKFQDANKYARFQSFFSNDNYFIADKDSINNNNPFDKLLNVERIVSIKQMEKKLKRRQTMMEKEHESPMKKKNEFMDQHLLEMMEIITIVDVEEQARFLCLVFHLIFQLHFPELNQYLIFIQNTTFLFDHPPQFDQPNVYRIAIFYERLEYSLKDLQGVLTANKLELSNFLHLKLSLDLLKILINCYKQYVFRLNFTLSTIFYVQKFKCFKLETFGRMKSLLPLQNNIEQLLKSIDEKKFIAYKKAFHKDLNAICDLIIYFKKVNGTSLRTITNKRKKFIKNLQKGETDDLTDNYIRLAEDIFAKEQDKYLLEFVKIVIFSSKSENFDVTLQNIESIIESLQKQVFKYEAKQEQEEIQKEKGDVINLDEINLSQSAISHEDEQENYFRQFDIDFNEVYEKLMKNKYKLSEAQLLFKEINYESLFFQNGNFEDLSRQARNLTLPKLEQAQVLVFDAFYYIKQLKDESWEIKSITVSKLIEEAIPILNSVNAENVDHFHFGILFQIITLSQRKPIVLLHQFQRCLMQQLEFKQKQHNKLRGKNQAKGLIEQKKHVIMQTMYAQSYLQNNNYFEAISKIQKIVGFQLKNQHNLSLLYGYTLLISGEMARLSSQPVSAMLNLEMSLQIYNSFFPETLVIDVIDDSKKKQQEPEFPIIKEEQQIITKVLKFENLATTNLAKVEFLLGMSYFDSHDQENSLKSLRRAQQLMQRQYSIFADEVISLVIQQLHIYVLQDDVGAAMKIALDYNREMNIFYREGKQFRRKCISKLQFIIGCIFQFSGSYLSALRYIERSNRTLTNSKTNNFVIQAHFQAKKMAIIELIKKAFQKIKNKQSTKNSLDLTQFQTLNDVLSFAFQNQFFCQPSQFHASIFFKKFQKNVMRVQGFARLGEKETAINLINELVKASQKGQKDEFYAYLKYKLCYLSIETEKTSNKQLDEFFALTETFDRYLQFPKKQLCKLQIQLMLFCVLSKLGEVKKLNQVAAKIDDFIQEIYQIFDWQVIAPKVSKNNGKFERFKTIGNLQLLVQIQNLLDLIQFFYIVRKKIFDSYDNPSQQKEIGAIWLKKLFNLKSFGQKFLEKKQDCLLGHQQKVKIKIENEIENTNTKSEQKQLKSSLMIAQPEKEQNIDQQEKSQKIVLDLRSYEEILISHKNQKTVQHSKQLSQEAIKDEKRENQDVNASKHRRNITEQTAATQSQKLKKMKGPVKLNPFEGTKMKKSVKV